MATFLSTLLTVVALSLVAPTGTVAPDICEYSVAAAVNEVRGEEGLNGLTSPVAVLQTGVENRAQALTQSHSAAAPIANEVIARGGKGMTAEELVDVMLSVEEYRDALLDPDATQLAVGVEVDEFGYPIIVASTGR